MQRRTFYSLIAITVSFLAYCFAVGPLRHAFDDRWPYINVFLNSPGGAAETMASVAGLILAGRSACIGNKNAKLYAAGFGLILLGALMNAMYAAWALDHRIELDSLVFNHPLRLALWEGYFRIEVNRCVSAIGIALVVWAASRSLQMSDEGNQIKEP